MKALGPEASALLEAARHGDEPNEADARRVREAVAVRIAAGVGGAAGALGAAAAAKSWVTALVRLGAKGPIAAALLVAMGTGVTVGVHRTWGPRTLAWRAIAPAVLAQPAPVTASASAQASWGPSVALATPPSPAASSLDAFAKHAPAPADSSPHRGPSTGDVAAEVRLLVEAHRALDDGDARRGLALLDDHARRYPSGALGEERDAARVRALCSLGRVSEAREVTERLLRASPWSPQAGPLRASCGGARNSPASTSPSF
jgi:hypothetical protein